MINTAEMWGAARLVPADAQAAWGARLIITQDGDVDILPDRQSAVGDDDAVDALLGVLNGGVIAAFREALSTMLKAGEVQTRVRREVTVYEDDRVLVRGNSNASAGYFYIAAWLKGK